jgi:hypothetical protein
MACLNLFDWLDQHSGSATALVTLVLACITSVYVYFTHGLLTEARKESENRKERELNEQARFVGGHIDWTGENRSANRSSLTLTVENESPLPVRAVVGHVHDRSEPHAYLFSFTSMPVVRHSETTSTVHVPYNEYKDKSLVLYLDFDDDAGTRWRKYESEDAPLRRLKTEEQERSRNPPTVLSPQMT